MCVLIVEDEFLIRRILSEVLTEQGYTVWDVSTGDEALAVIETLDPPMSLLVTDVHMPGQTDGIALARHVGANWPHVPVIYTTGRPDVLETPDLLSGRRLLVRKPYVPSEIVRHIERFPDVVAQRKAS